jgi:ribosomal protein S12 methylthiotransferase accessory factor
MIPDLPSHERSFTARRAIEVAQALSSKFKDERGINLKKTEMVVAGRFCVTAIDASGDVVVAGFGKGVHSDIGAFGECVEHLHLTDIALNPEYYEVEVDPGKIWVDDIFFRVGQSLACGGARVRAIPHKILGRDEVTYVPSLMFGLRRSGEETCFNDRDLFYSRYSSSNGSAFGLSFHDALLHAMLEVIERHEISLLFLELIGQASVQCTYDLIGEYNFNPEIRVLADEIAGVGVSQALSTLVKKNEFGTYFAFSYVRHGFGGKDRLIWGAGCSHFRDLAIYRSVAECQQSLGIDLPKEDDQVGLLAKKYPAFRAIENFDIKALNWRTARLSPETIVPITTIDQVNKLNQAINALGRYVLFFEHEAIDSSYNVVTVYITNTEKFFGIMFANPVVPISHLNTWLASRSRETLPS